MFPHRPGIPPTLTAIAVKSSGPTTLSFAYFLYFSDFSVSELRTRMTYSRIGTSRTTPTGVSGTESAIPGSPLSCADRFNPYAPFIEHSQDVWSAFHAFDGNPSAKKRNRQIHFEPALVKLQSKLDRKVLVREFPVISPKVLTVFSHRPAAVIDPISHIVIDVATCFALPVLEQLTLPSHSQLSVSDPARPCLGLPPTRPNFLPLPLGCHSALPALVRRGRYRGRSAAVPDRVPDDRRRGGPRRRAAVPAGVPEPRGSPEPEPQPVALPGAGCDAPDGERRAAVPAASGERLCGA